MAIETIAVLGAGQMGSGIAQIAATNGYKVIMRDIKQEFCDKGVATIKKGLDKQVAKGKTRRRLLTLSWRTSPPPLSWRALLPLTS